MESKELQSTYTNLKQRLDDLKLKKVRLETRIEDAETKYKESTENIKKIANVESVEEASKVVEKITAKVESVLKKAEKLIDEIEDLY